MATGKETSYHGYKSDYLKKKKKVINIDMVLIIGMDDI